MMAGYERDVHMTGRVLSALAKAMEKYPNMRLGQLLYAAVSKDYEHTTSESVGNSIFLIHDEELITALEAFSK